MPRSTKAASATTKKKLQSNKSNKSNSELANSLLQSDPQSEEANPISESDALNINDVNVCGKSNKIIEDIITESNLRSSDSLDETVQNEANIENNERKELTIAQRAQIEVNRQKALLIRQEKLNKRKIYEKVEKEPENVKVIRINDSKLVDSGGGFFIEEKPNEVTPEDLAAAMQLVTEPAPLLQEDQPFCDDCSRPFDNSYVYHNFGLAVCDECRDPDDKHSLITKTDAKVNYLLNDSDFDRRNPPLKYILKKNPHNSRWGEMKLYLKLQVEKRALEVWESEEALEEAMEKRDEQREVSKQRKYMKKMKELRMNVRSSLYTRATKTHEHEYEDEVYHSDEDEYSRTCSSCGHSYTYDKM